MDRIKNFPISHFLCYNNPIKRIHGGCNGAISEVNQKMAVFQYYQSF